MRYSRFVLRLSIAVWVFLALPHPVLAEQREASGSCNQPTAEPVVRVDLPGHPFKAVATTDGCWIFVSMQGRPPLQSGVAVVHRSGGKVSLDRVVSLGSSVELVLSHDGKMLIVTNDDYVDFLDVAQLKSGQRDPKLGRIYGGMGAFESNVNVTPDDRFLFVSDHAVPKETASVYRLEDARKAGFKGDFKVGTIHAGREVLALVFSKDQRYLYIVSEQAGSDSTWSEACPQNVAARKKPIEGIVAVVDVERAKTDPANSIVSRVKAGCVATRLTLSPKGDRAYVTARADDALVVLDTTKFVADPEHAKVATVPVGKSPTGSTLMDGGAKVIVSNIGSAGEQQSLTVIDAGKVASGAAAVVGKIPVGSGPRDATLMNDGRTLFVPNFNSNTLQLIDLKRVGISPAS